MNKLILFCKIQYFSDWNTNRGKINLQKDAVHFLGMMHRRRQNPSWISTMIFFLQQRRSLCLRTKRTREEHWIKHKVSISLRPSIVQVIQLRSLSLLGSMTTFEWHRVWTVLRQWRATHMSPQNLLLCILLISALHSTDLDYPFRLRVNIKSHLRIVTRHNDERQKITAVGSVG